MMWCRAVTVVMVIRHTPGVGPTTSWTGFALSLYVLRVHPSLCGEYASRCWWLTLETCDRHLVDT